MDQEQLAGYIVESKTKGMYNLQEMDCDYYWVNVGKSWRDGHI